VVKVQWNERSRRYRGTETLIDLSSLHVTCACVWGWQMSHCMFVCLCMLQHYDDKVDIWSIGSLLYKVIVGQCGFYAVSRSFLFYLLAKSWCGCVWLSTCGCGLSALWAPVTQVSQKPAQITWVAWLIYNSLAGSCRFRVKVMVVTVILTSMYVVVAIP